MVNWVGGQGETVPRLRCPDPEGSKESWVRTQLNRNAEEELGQNCAALPPGQSSSPLVIGYAEPSSPPPIPEMPASGVLERKHPGKWLISTAWEDTQIPGTKAWEL